MEVKFSFVLAEDSPAKPDPATVMALCAEHWPRGKVTVASASGEHFTLDIRPTADLYFQLDYSVLDENQVERETYPETYEALIAAGGSFQATFPDLPKPMRADAFAFLAKLDAHYTLRWWIEDAITVFPDERAFTRLFNDFYFF